MLEGLYITKSRVGQDILTLFFANPTKKYYLRELERLLAYSAGNIRRELLKFMKDDLFLTERYANLLYLGKKNSTGFIKDVLKKPKIFLVGSEDEI